jgi:GNAT superfamily N-acetyltransferase
MSDSEARPAARTKAEKAAMKRIVVRPAKAGDLALIEAWYAEASAAVHGGTNPESEQDLRERYRGGGLLVIAKVDDPGVPVGLVDRRLGWPVRGWVTIEFIALASGQRGWGYGSEAVRQLEERNADARFLAQIDPGNGLALYFWLRLGYRPARADEVFWRATDEGGIIAMVRDSGTA